MTACTASWCPCPHLPRPLLQHPGSCAEPDFRPSGHPAGQVKRVNADLTKTWSQKPLTQSISIDGCVDVQQASCALRLHRCCKGLRTWPVSLSEDRYISTSKRPLGASTCTWSKVTTALPMAAPASVCWTTSSWKRCRGCRTGELGSHNTEQANGVLWCRGCRAGAAVVGIREVESNGGAKKGS